MPLLINLKLRGSALPGFSGRKSEEGKKTKSKIVYCKLEQVLASLNI